MLLFPLTTTPCTHEVSLHAAPAFWRLGVEARRARVNIFGLWQEDLYDQDFGVTRRRQGLGASEPFPLELAQAQGLCDEPVEHEVVS